jgi:transglutaminase-like putative cysteine protease
MGMRREFRALGLRLLAAAVLLLGASRPGWGGLKHDPVPQWGLEAAKTPTPASAKGAPAVLLFSEYLETVDAQGRAVERTREAIRILAPQRRHEGCAVSYDVDEKIDYFRAWTITADEKHLQAQESDFVEQGEGGDVLLFTEKTRVVHPPGTDVGATVICESEELLAPYQQEKLWWIQQQIPAVFQALEIDLPAGRAHAESWHRAQPVKPVEVAPNHWRWEIRNMPELDLENQHATPYWAALAARMSVHWGDTAVGGTENQWRAICRWQQQLESQRHDASPEITAKVQELVAGSPDFYSKLKRITDYVQKNIRYFVVERGIGGWQPHYAADIFRSRYGDCKDKTTLLIAMLGAAGIRAHSLSVDHRRGFVDPAAPSRYGDHMITAVELPEGENDPRLQARVRVSNGKTLLIFDPTDEATPVGLLRQELQGGWGYLGSEEDGQILQIPVLPPDSSGVTRKGVFTLAADGALAGDVTESYLGIDGGSERLFIRRHDAKEIREGIERRLGSSLAGLTFKGYEFHREAELDQPLELELHFSASSYARSAGSLLLVRPRVLGSYVLSVPEVMEGKERLYPIELGHPGRWRDSFDIALPEGYAVDEAPDPVDVDMGFARYHAVATAQAGTLHYECEYVVRQVEIPAERAADFRRLENAILSAEKRAAVLKQATAPGPPTVSELTATDYRKTE